jgi:hypothetical protein
MLDSGVFEGDRSTIGKVTFNSGKSYPDLLELSSNVIEIRRNSVGVQINFQVDFRETADR